MLAEGNNSVCVFYVHIANVFIGLQQLDLVPLMTV